MSKYIYLAGLFDGEGTVGISRDSSRKTRAPYLSITSTTIELIEFLHENFGGTVCNQKTYQEHHKKSWSWRLRNKEQIFALIEKIEPYMLEPAKKKRMHLLLVYYDSVTPRNGKYTEEMKLLKEKFEEEFLSIK